MLTNADDPSVTLPKLRYKSLKDSGMLRGVYRLAGDKVGSLLFLPLGTEISVKYMGEDKSVFRGVLLDSFDGVLALILAWRYHKAHKGKGFMTLRFEQLNVIRMG